MTKGVKPIFVMDACALLRLAQAEPGTAKVAEYLYSARRGECEILMHQINLGEVVYRIGKTHGWALAERKRHEITLLPVTVIPFDDILFWQAVQLKANYPMSYADCFATALAMGREATLLTADPEFACLAERLTRIAIEEPRRAT
ncbi:type II toxin-antitoxin system VapC family toxin [Methylococcus sp. ANG]|uniref:type II toxin-antitoxin system VapC family toxin n=1 Tax=Methylococcus sp. ANG TaxID=3231903 RepID=UPI00345B12A3